MKRHKLLALAAALILSGCVNPSQQPPVTAELDQAISKIFAP